LPMTTLAVFVFDPGKISGCGCGVFDMTVGGTAYDVYKNGTVETWETEGPWKDQADEIAETYREWYMEQVEHGQRLADIVLVSEDFQLTRRTKSGDVQMLSGQWVLWPVKISAAVELAVAPHEVEYQQPAQAKTYATDGRLRRWGLWTPSSRDHRRDATRHILLAIHKRLK
jgi:hypothetical protein